MQIENHHHPPRTPTRPAAYQRCACFLRTSMQQHTACVKCSNDRGHASRRRASQPQQWLIAVRHTHRRSTHRHKAETNFYDGGTAHAVYKKDPTPVLRTIPVFPDRCKNYFQILPEVSQSWLQPAQPAAGLSSSNNPNRVVLGCVCCIARRVLILGRLGGSLHSRCDSSSRKMSRPRADGFTHDRAS